jgi:sulfur-carrier protein adenylyltransferase/sulfurtransferase
MTALELKDKLDQQADIQVIDLREEYEFEDGSISEINIPLAEVMGRLDELNREKEVVIYCNSGKRSQSMLFMLQKQHGFSNIEHLEGGYQAWLEEIVFA